MSVLEVNTDTFDDEVMDAECPVLIDFWGPACQPCLALGPTVEAISEAYDDNLKVIKVDASQNRRLCIRLRVMSLPTFLVFRDGEEVDRLSGTVAKEQLKALAGRLAGEEPAHAE